MEENKKKVPLFTKDDLAQSGMIAGGTTAAIGGTLAGLAAMKLRILGSSKISEKEKADLLERINKKATSKGFKDATSYLKHSRKTGLIGLSVGVPVLGVSSYLHHKYKKQMKEDSKNKSNNN